MGTPAVLRFQTDGEDRGVVYRHYDGNPEATVSDIVRFFTAVSVIPVAGLPRGVSESS